MGLGSSQESQERSRVVALLVAVAVGAAIAAVTPAAAQDASWLANPGSGDLSVGSNWSTGSVPGVSNTGFFDSSTTTALTISAPALSVGGWTFNADASNYTATVAGQLTFTLGGITVNGGSIALVNNGGTTTFLNASTAGLASITNRNGGGTVFGMFGGTDTASAGNASIIDTKGSGMAFLAMTSAGKATIVNQFGSTIEFTDSSSAASASITNQKGSAVVFEGQSTATNASITNRSGATVIFSADSNSGNATIINSSHGGFVLPVGLAFLDASLAGTATIINNGNGLTGFGVPGGTDTTSADHAQIINNAGGGTQFDAFSTAGNATIITNSGGAVIFFDNSTGGLAQFITNGTGTADFGSSLGPNADGQISAGSIAGSGTYYIGGGNTLTVGGNGLSTEVSGVIADSIPCGCSPGPGALVKTGPGTLTLSGLNTYSAGTTLAGGMLSVSQEANLGALAGGLTFNGGILQITGTSFTSTARTISWGAAGGGFDIADPGNVFTVSQSLGAGGTLTKLGAGTLVLGGANLYSGGTIVQAGTLAISADNNLGGGPMTLLNGTTLKLLSGFTLTHAVTVMGDPTFDVASGNVNTLSGTISDGASPGDIVKTGAGTLITTAANSYTGATTITGGTFALSGAGSIAASAGVIDNSVFDISAASGGTASITTLSGTGSVALGANTLNLTNAQGSFAGTIGGTGGLTLSGGSFTLAGASSYTGQTLVAGGSLLVNGAIVGSTVTVANGALLGGSGSIGGLVAQGGGTVAPGVAVPFTTMSVIGNATFASGSTFLVNVNAAGQTDKLAISGTASLQGGTVQVLAGTGIYSPLNRYTILTATGGVSGTYAQLATSSNLSQAFAFLTPSLSYDANDVFLGFKQTTPFASVAVTRNQAAAATALQGLGFGNPLYNVLVSQGFAGVSQSFDALSGEVHASAVTAAFEDQRLPRDAIFDRLSGPGDTPVLGAATTMTGAYAADLPTRKGPQHAPVEVRMYQPHLFGLWGQGFGAWGTTDTDHNAAKLSRDTGGFIIGADTSVSTGWSGVWRLGVAGGYTDDSLKVSGRLSSGDFQSVFGAVYGGTSLGAVDLKLGAIAASSDTHTSRTISFPMFSGAASSSYGGYAVQGFAEAGYRLPWHWSLWNSVSGLESLSVNYEPFLQAAIIHLGQDRYNETSFAGGFGGAAGLIGAARSYDIGTTTLGLRTEYKLASLPGFTLRTLIGWRYAYGDVRPSVSQSFAGAFGSFTVAGVPVDRNALVSETNLDYAVSAAVTVGLSYAGQLGNRASDNAFKGHVDVSF